MTVSTHIDRHIAVLTLDYPKQHNALSTALVRDLSAAVNALDAQDVRAIVIAASGKFFSAGANISDLLDAGWMSGKADAQNPVSLFELLGTHRLPVIAAVGGPAIGGGFELCLCCDLVVAATSAWFSTPEVGLGVMPNTAMARLPAMVGSRRALEIVMTGRRIEAAEALSMGLVNQIVPQSDVVGMAVQLALNIVGKAPPGALRTIKQGLSAYGPTDWNAVRESLTRLPEPEWREGLSKFLEKKTPDYETFWQANR